ncbi:hypothetical protein KKF84_00965 [Myxococcota bacterium]|nr:hypothetical protein [Myxococcota bacterium]MBU1533856.1 hypothetical protein [Myxococcota bacterium]
MIRQILTALIIFSSGCIAPEGDGIVGGEIFILGCNETDNYGEEQYPAYFDLQANFFVGEPVKDESAVPTDHRLDIRLQKGTNTIEDADSLYIQMTKVSLAARRFAAWEPIPVGVDHNVKASLSLYLTCPSFFDGPEASPASAEACPVLTQQEQQELCDSTVYGDMDQLRLPHAPFSLGQSCIVLCQFGKANRGDTITDDFSIDFSDVVSGVYFFTLWNRRMVYNSTEICDDQIDNDGDGIIDEELCQNVSAGGFVQGNFTIKLRRAKAIQAFP